MFLSILTRNKAHSTHCPIVAAYPAPLAAFFGAKNRQREVPYEAAPAIGRCLFQHLLTAGAQRCIERHLKRQHPLDGFLSAELQVKEQIYINQDPKI